MSFPEIDRADTFGADLESCIDAIEQRLASLGDALRGSDAQAVDHHGAELHRALAVAVQRFGQAARSGRVPAGLRSRLARASGRVAAQRESLARATAALDRAIEVLLPGAAHAPAAVYSASGAAERPHHGPLLQA